MPGQNIIMLVGDDIRDANDKYVHKELIFALKNLTHIEASPIKTVDGYEVCYDYLNFTMEDECYEFRFETTSGNQEYPGIRRDNYRHYAPKCIIVLFDCNNRRSFERVTTEYFPEISTYRPNTAVILVGIKNNVSLYNYKQVINPVSAAEAETVAATYRIKYLECDLKNPQEVAEVGRVAIRYGFGWWKAVELWDKAHEQHCQPYRDKLDDLKNLRRDRKNYLSLLPEEIVNPVSESVVVQESRMPFLGSSKGTYLIAMGMFKAKESPKVETKTLPVQPVARADNAPVDTNHAPNACILI